MKNLVKKLVEKLLEKPLRKLARWAAEQNAAADAAREAEASGGTAATDAGGMGVPASPSSDAGVSDPLAGASSENPPPSSKPWRECRKSSNWNGSNAAKRMMNAVSPKFAETKFREYLDLWVRRRQLQADIEARGITIFDHARQTWNENRSVTLELQTSRQMLAIYNALGFREAPGSGRSAEPDDAL